MRRTAVDAVRGYLAFLHRQRPTSISHRALASFDPLTQALSPGLCRADRLHTLRCTHLSRRHVSGMATDNLRQLEALMSRLDRDRAALQQPADVSRRTPNTIYTQFNEADKIERHLRADGHRIWGFVVYRCTYSSDPAWESCIQRINASVQEAMDLYNGHDLLQDGCFKLTVIADASMLDGASTQAVRRHFREWCTRAVHEEQGSQEEIRSRKHESSPCDWGWPVRYGFCIQIDEASMRSVISEEGERWVNLIKRDWEPREATRQQQQQQQQHETGPTRVVESPGEHGDDEGEFIDDEDEEEYPAIEGCTDHDVGWMKVQLVGLMPDFYTGLRDPDLWYIPYIRPPGIATD
ncbi:hypothetical protein F4823DRAFT_626205 [Ustulina deusta]|nr:hypothetical protein F4823DRAFT_626205 [Ustulina deusta]